MNKHRILEIITATMIGAGVTMLSKVVEAYIMEHISLASNVAGGIAASAAYLVERYKQIL